MQHEIDTGDARPVKGRMYHAGPGERAAMDPELDIMTQKENHRGFSKPMGISSCDGTKEGWQASLLC